MGDLAVTEPSDICATASVESHVVSRQEHANIFLRNERGRVPQIRIRRPAREPNYQVWKRSKKKLSLAINRLGGVVPPRLEGARLIGRLKWQLFKSEVILWLCVLVSALLSFLLLAERPNAPFGARGQSIDESRDSGRRLILRIIGCHVVVPAHF